MTSRSYNSKKTKKYYFDVGDIIEKYPDAIIYSNIGGRNTGKTYSSLLYMLQHKIKFVFVKRTMDDVAILCAGNGKLKKSKPNEYAVDLSPFVAINRDHFTNIKAFSVINGLGAFYPCDEEGVPTEDAIGYIVALSAVSKVKGFDLSVCDCIIFDEFIPQPWDRVNRKEGEQLMELYKTVSRDREHRGKAPLKLILLANATMASNPVFDTLELVDRVVEMELKNEHEVYLEDRGIVLNRLQTSAEFNSVEEKSKIYQTMTGTQWAAMALKNEFGYDDFSAVKKIDLRRYSLYCRFKHKQKTYYIYYNDSRYYVTYRQNGKRPESDLYDLKRQTEAERFYYDIVLDLRAEAIDDRVYFDTYTLYDLIINFKKHYIIGTR